MTPIRLSGPASLGLARQVWDRIRPLADAGKAVEIIIRAPRAQRSLDQSAYAHAVPFKLIADAMGESIEAAKLCILGERFGWHEVRGHLLPVKPSTAALTKEEFSDLIEWMVPFGLETFGLVIPLPNEATW